MNEVLAATAYHEAGHAIGYIYLPLPLPLRLVSIKRKGHSLGRVEPGFNVNLPWSPTERRDIITMLLSGRPAEQKGTGKNLHFETDYFYALQLALNGTHQDKESAVQLVNECHQPAGELLLANWADVDRLAKALIEQREMTAEEVFALLELSRTLPLSD
ncbi:MAG: Peptidase family [Verrucomicrobiota bacterium]|jgi:ATP-dependent Zn protease